MTEPLFTPPFPQPTRNKRTMLRRFFIGWHSWIHVLFEKSYTMKIPMKALKKNLFCCIYERLISGRK